MSTTYHTAYENDQASDRVDRTARWVREQFETSSGIRITRTRLRPEYVARSVVSAPAMVDYPSRAHPVSRVHTPRRGSFASATSVDTGLEITPSPRIRRQYRLAVDHMIAVLPLRQFSSPPARCGYPVGRVVTSWEGRKELPVLVLKAFGNLIITAAHVPWVPLVMGIRMAAWVRQTLHTIRQWWWRHPFERVQMEEDQLCTTHGVDRELYSYLSRKVAFTQRSIQRQNELKSRAEAWVEEHRKEWDDQRTSDQIMRVLPLVLVETPGEKASKMVLGYGSQGLLRANSYARSGILGPWWSLYAGVTIPTR